MKKDHPFKVPEDYFEKLGDRIQDRINEEENPKEKRILQMLSPYLWMAASIIGIVLIAKIILTSSVSNDFKINTLSQTNTTVVDTQKNIQGESENSNLLFNEISDATSDDLIEYLSDFDIETETLLANL